MRISEDAFLHLTRILLLYGIFSFFMVQYFERSQNGHFCEYFLTLTVYFLWKFQLQFFFGYWDKTNVRFGPVNKKNGDFRPTEIKAGTSAFISQTWYISLRFYFQCFFSTRYKANAKTSASTRKGQILTVCLKLSPLISKKSLTLLKRLTASYLS